ncbi:hypothetical protein VPH35_000439 [Triticum aestivum]
MRRWSCGADALSQLPAAALFVRAQAPGEATSHLPPMVPPPPTHTQLPLPRSHGSRSEWYKVPSVLVVRNEAGGLCSLIFWRVAGAPISLSHLWRQRHQEALSFSL